MAVLDMLELHQFRHSAFCLKVRMVLQAKGLSFRTVEVTPGVGQVAVFRLSGQRQVPVLVDGDQVIADSSAIALHLDQRELDPALIPTDPRQATSPPAKRRRRPRANKGRGGTPPRLWRSPARALDTAVNRCCLRQARGRAHRK